MYSLSQKVMAPIPHKVCFGVRNIFGLSVVGCNKEPIPGWIDNVYGPTGVSAGNLHKFHIVMSLKTGPKNLQLIKTVGFSTE